MNKINTEILADSICNGNRITSMILTIPQIIVKELLRHRMFSFSSSSMRAIPFKKVIQDIKENMFVPLAFQGHHPGMQGIEYLSGEKAEEAKQQWIETALRACDEAERLYNTGVTKQLCSRIIEPYGFARILVTATEWENFFELRCPKYQTPVSRTVEPQRSWKDLLAVHGNPSNEKLITDNKDNWSFKMQYSLSSAEIHIQALAEAMWDAINESTPKELKSGEWHLPFSDKINDGKLAQVISPNKALIYSNINLQELRLKVCVSRCARLSYMTFDNEIDYEKDIQLHDRLLADGHMSPFEHCARAMSNEEYESFIKGNVDIGFDIPKETQGWCNNFKGFIPYRYLIENKI